MLEQRRAQKSGYITLKEASALCGYSSDYIGQLIRNGKIRGEQVYSNVAWVTTPEDIETYMRQKESSISPKQTFLLYEFLVSHKWSRYVLYGIISMLVLSILIMQYILYVTIDDRFSDTIEAKTLNEDVLEVLTVTSYE